MTGWQKRARLVVAIVGLAALVLVVLTVRRRPPAESGPTTPPRDPKAVTEASRGRILLTKGERSVGFIDHEHSLTYADGTTKLLKACATITRSDRTTEICANEAEVASDRSELTMSGDVRVSSGDGLTARMARATYREKEGLVRAPGKVTFAKGAVTGSSVGMTYHEEHDRLTLHRQVNVVLKPAEGQSGATITAETAEYPRAEKYMKFDGKVRMERAGRVITTDSAVARLSADEERMEALELRGASRIETTGSTGGRQTMQARDMNLTMGADGEALQRAVLIGNGSVEEAGSQARTRRISAETLDLTFHDSGELASITAREDVELTLPAQGEAPFREITSATMDGTGAPGGGLDAARFGGGVVFREGVRGRDGRVARSRTLEIALDPATGEIRDARFGGGTTVTDGTLRTSSADARYELTKGVLALRGAVGRSDPRVEDERLAVDAERIDVTLDGPKLRAEGRVRSVIQPERKEATPKPKARARAVPGMLKESEPAYVTSATLDYDGERSLATYSGDSRLWQGETTIQAPTIVIDEESGNLEAREPVRTTFLLEERDEKTGETKSVASRASAKTLHYDNQHRRATYTTDASMSGPQGDLRAHRIVLFFAEGGGSLDRAQAFTDVRLEDEIRTVTGAELTYFASETRSVMTGAPVRSVEECRETTCKTLTFWRSTDRILCDGNEENRTLTKSVGSCTEPRPK